MRCPFCNHGDTQVKDTRPTSEGAVVRRRRRCERCTARFTTFERVQLRELTVVKRSGTHELFDRDKLERSLKVALRKRPITTDAIDAMVSSVVRRLEHTGSPEIGAATLGEMVMDCLKHKDPVGYVRYASVYRDFQKVTDFASFISSEIATTDEDASGQLFQAHQKPLPSS